MPQYLGVLAFEEQGISIHPGNSIKTTKFLTEVIVSVPSPLLYSGWEQVQIGGVSCTGYIFDRTDAGLHLLRVVGTVPTGAVTITGVNSGQTQTGTATVLNRRLSDSPIYTPCLSAQLITATGANDGSHFHVLRRASVITIAVLSGGPLTIYNTATAYTETEKILAVIETAQGYVYVPNGESEYILLGFTSSGSCRVHQFEDSPQAEMIRYLART